jgi:hypothetical protein
MAQFFSLGENIILKIKLCCFFFYLFKDFVHGEPLKNENALTYCTAASHVWQ